MQAPINLGGSTNVTFECVANWLAATPSARGARASRRVRGHPVLNFDSTLGWNFATPVGLITPGGKVSQTLNKWDAIAGFKGQVRFGETNWFMPYYADIGTGSDNWTWQAIVGVGYRFGWGELSLVVRSLSYYFDDDKLDLRLTGPALGATFAF